MGHARSACANEESWPRPSKGRHLLSHPSHCWQGREVRTEKKRAAKGAHRAYHCPPLYSTAPAQAHPTALYYAVPPPHYTALRRFCRGAPPRVLPGLPSLAFIRGRAPPPPAAAHLPLPLACSLARASPLFVLAPALALGACPCPSVPSPPARHPPRRHC